MSTSIRIASLLACAVILAACGDSAPPPTAPPAAGPAAGVAPSAQEQPATPVSTETAEELLARANDALAADRLFEPAGDNALEYYLAALSQAEKEAAEEGATGEKTTRRLTDAMATADLVTRTKLAINDILPYGLVWVERAINNDSRPEAARVLALLERAQPGASSLQRMREQLAAAEVAAEREAARAVAAAEAAEARAAAAATAPPPEQPAPEPTKPAPAPATAKPPVAATPTPTPATPTPTTTPTPTPVAAPATLPPGAMPKLISQPALRYPTQAMRKQEEGYAVVTFTINPDGTTSNVDVTRAVPRGLFEREAERIVSGLKFQPPGRPIQTERQIDFKLK